MLAPLVPAGRLFWHLDAAASPQNLDQHRRPHASPHAFAPGPARLLAPGPLWLAGARQYSASLRCGRRGTRTRHGCAPQDRGQCSRIAGAALALVAAGAQLSLEPTWSELLVGATSPPGEVDDSRKPGSERMKCAPSPGGDCTTRSPPWAWAIFLAR